MGIKTFQGTLGTKKFNIDLPGDYEPIAAAAGFELVAAADVEAGDYSAPLQTLLDNFLVVQLSVGLANKKRTRMVISFEKLGARKELIGKSFRNSTIRSVTPRKYTKLTA
jgi:hypothetical protein